MEPFSFKAFTQAMQRDTQVAGDSTPEEAEFAEQMLNTIGHRPNFALYTDFKEGWKRGQAETQQ